MNKQEEQALDYQLAYCGLFQNITTIADTLLSAKTFDNEYIKGIVVRVIGHPYKKEFYVEYINYDLDSGWDLNSIYKTFKTFSINEMVDFLKSIR